MIAKENYRDASFQPIHQQVSAPTIDRSAFIRGSRILQDDGKFVIISFYELIQRGNQLLNFAQLYHEIHSPLLYPVNLYICRKLMSRSNCWSFIMLLHVRVFSDLFFLLNTLSYPLNSNPVFTCSLRHFLSTLSNLHHVKRYLKQNDIFSSRLAFLLRGGFFTLSLLRTCVRHLFLLVSILSYRVIVYSIFFPAISVVCCWYLVISLAHHHISHN